MNQSDPTDHALAAIASLLDHPAENLSPKAEAKVDVEPAAKPDAMSELTAEPEVSLVPSVPAQAAAAEIDVDHYEKSGPGPLDAIRFRWTARVDDDGHYYVDETIGPNSRALSSGPMPKSEVIRFIDDRAREAEQRFNALKDEMTLTAHEPDYPRDDSGES